MSTFPQIENRWTIGNIITIVLSSMSLFVMIGGWIWFAARLDFSVSTIPQLTKSEEEDRQEIIKIQDHELFTDQRYDEISVELKEISNKLDNQQDEIYEEGITSRHK